jgi:monoamine oxidase
LSERVRDDSVQVLIVGAGVAGLACAERLARAGISFTILEARDRIGGRALTDYSLTPGQPLELGAQMIHGRHVVTHSWAHESGLRTRPWRLSQRALIAIDGRMCQAPWFALPGYPGFGLGAFLEGVRRIPRELREMPPPDCSLAEFLDRRHPSLGARRLVELLHAHTYAADFDEIGVRGPAEEDRRAGEEYGYRNFQLVEGYTELIRRHSAALLSRIRTGARATAIRRSPQGVQVLVQIAGEPEPMTYVARVAVVTLPLGVLKSDPSLFDPPLPAAKLAAIQRIAFGMGYALQLRMKGGDLVHRYGDFSMVWAGGASTFLRPGAHRRGMPEVLTAFTVGREAARRAAMSTRDRVDATLEELRAAFPGPAQVGEVAAQSVQLWPTDPHARGAYSFLPPGVDPSERQVLAQPVDGVLFFAGEATHWGGESATVHGAIETGQRAAEEVQAALGERHSGPPSEGGKV